MKITSLSEPSKLLKLKIMLLGALLVACGDQVAKQPETAVSPKAKDATPTVTGAQLTPEQIKTLLETKLAGIEIASVDVSPKAGFYQAFYGGEILYVSTDGQFIFTGNLLEIGGNEPVNHTQIAVYEKEAERAPERAKAIADMSESDMVVFKAPDEKYKITVFTDVDCAYCRKLHKEMPLLNKNGITVRYLAFPRAGVGSSAYNKLVSVWCADDRVAAMNDAKLNRKFSNATCENPVASQYQLTRQFGLSGTPALILSDGELISGYLPADKLAEHLQRKAGANNGDDEESIAESTGK